MGGGFAAPAASRVPPCGAGSFLHGQKGTKEPPRVGAEGQDRLRRSCPNDAHPWTPFYESAN